MEKQCSKRLTLNQRRNVLTTALFILSTRSMSALQCLVDNPGFLLQNCTQFGKLYDHVCVESSFFGLHQAKSRNLFTSEQKLFSVEMVLQTLLRQCWFEPGYLDAMLSATTARSFAGALGSMKLFGGALQFTLYTLYTLHSTLSTPHSTLYTLRSTLSIGTPHSTLHTLHPTLHTLHSSLYTLHSTLHALHFTLHTPHSTLYTLHSTLYTLYTPHSTLYTPHSLLYTPHSTLYTFHSTLHTLHFPLHTADWQQGKNVQDSSKKLLQKSVLRDCISMCFDICAINIRVSIRVRGLHLVLFFTNIFDGERPMNSPMFGAEIS